MAVGAFWLIGPDIVLEALSLGVGVIRDVLEIGNVTVGSLVVELHCYSKKSFVEFMDAYESGNLKTNLSYEFFKIGFGEVTVEIEKIEEAIKLREKFR